MSWHDITHSLQPQLHQNCSLFLRHTQGHLLDWNFLLDHHHHHHFMYESNHARIKWLSYYPFYLHIYKRERLQQCGLESLITAVQVATTTTLALQQQKHYIEAI